MGKQERLRFVSLEYQRPGQYQKKEMDLPTELWENILSISGPLQFSKHVNVAHVAAVRLQRAWRARRWRSGAVVIVHLHGLRRRGVLLRIHTIWCVRIADRRVCFLFLPHPRARIVLQNG